MRLLPILFCFSQSINSLKMSAVKEMMQVKRLSEFAIIPSRGSVFAAGKQAHPTNSALADHIGTGFDLSSAYDLVVPKKGKAIVKTDLSIAIPPETYARIGEHPISAATEPSQPTECIQLPEVDWR